MYPNKIKYKLSVFVNDDLVTSWVVITIKKPKIIVWVNIIWLKIIKFNQLRK